MIELAVPLTPKQIQIAGELHDTLEQWRLSDNALRRLHRALPEFDEEACLLKSVAVNQLYGTQVLAIIPMARNVQRVLSEPGATEKGTDLVDQIATLKLNDKTRHCTSFAAKFCHFFVDENGFPIYDDAAKQASSFTLVTDIQVTTASHTLRFAITSDDCVLLLASGGHLGLWIVTYGLSTCI
jgi:hypothetical protein